MFLKDETQWHVRAAGEETYSRITTRSGASGGWSKERKDLRAAPRQWISPSNLDIEEVETRLHEDHFPVDTAVEKSKDFGDNEQPEKPTTLSSTSSKER
jgi:hypothetical protein